VIVLHVSGAYSRRTNGVWTAAEGSASQGAFEQCSSCWPWREEVKRGRSYRAHSMYHEPDGKADGDGGAGRRFAHKPRSAYPSINVHGSFSLGDTLCPSELTGATCRYRAVRTSLSKPRAAICSPQHTGRGVFLPRPADQMLVPITASQPPFIVSAEYGQLHR
jgi:hypothetical protein